MNEPAQESHHEWRPPLPALSRRGRTQLRPRAGQSLRHLPKTLPQSHRIEVIDVLKEPLRALAETILVTPTAVKVSPEPELQIIGNLSDEEEVLRALGLPQKENG